MPLQEAKYSSKVNDIFQIERHSLYPYISLFLSVFSTKLKREFTVTLKKLFCTGCSD